MEPMTTERTLIMKRLTPDPGRYVSLNRTRGLKSLRDDFCKLLGRREGTHVDNQLIDPAIFVEVQLIDRLKLLALNLALKAKEVPIVPCVSRQNASYSGSGFGHLTQDKSCCVHRMIDAWSSRDLDADLRSKNLLQQTFVR